MVPIGWWIAFTAPWQSPFLKVLVEEGIPLMQPRTRTLGLRFDWGVAYATEKHRKAKKTVSRSMFGLNDFFKVKMHEKFIFPEQSSDTN